MKPKSTVDRVRNRDGRIKYPRTIHKLCANRHEDKLLIEFVNERYEQDGRVLITHSAFELDIPSMLRSTGRLMLQKLF
jgi:hypothetical protein